MSDTAERIVEEVWRGALDVLKGPPPKSFVHIDSAMDVTRRAVALTAKRCADVLAQTMSWEEGIHEILREFPEAGK